MYILREFEENGFKIIEYTTDGETVCARTEELICEPSEPSENQPVYEPVDVKVDRIEKELESQKQQNLVLMDVNATIFEELIGLKEQLSTLQTKMGVV